jgi:hypothetical protein
MSPTQSRTRMHALLTARGSPLPNRSSVCIINLMSSNQVGHTCISLGPPNQQVLWLSRGGTRHAHACGLHLQVKSHMHFNSNTPIRDRALEPPPPQRTTSRRWLRAWPPGRVLAPHDLTTHHDASTSLFFAVVVHKNVIWIKTTTRLHN